MFEDSQPQFGESQALTDSDGDVDFPPKKVAKIPMPASPCKAHIPITFQDLSDSDCEAEGPSDIEKEPLDPIVACKQPFLDGIARDRAFRMAEIFAGCGILAEEMSALGFVTRSVDFMTGGAEHDLSLEKNAPHL